VVLAHEREASLRGLTLTESADPAVISADRALLERLVSNLVENAMRHNVPHGTVAVGVTIEVGGAVLSVANTGPIVPADQVARLVQPFQRLAQDRIGRDGLGLGLSIVAAVADAHQASLDIQPQADGGLDVRVRFPLARETRFPAREPTPSFV
jgi:signal transduction histidine kinase